MRTLALPTITTNLVFEDCISRIGNAGKAIDFQNAKHLIDDAEIAYLTAARNHVLYQIPPSGEKNDEMLFGGLSKSDVKSLYSGQMVPAGKPARAHYDKLILSAPLRRCPFCGFGRATTLDHFLSKSNYPWLSIVPINLIPACKDCNQGKGASVARSAHDQVLHPYFESDALENDQWLFAAVVESTPLSIEYRADPPNHWSEDLKNRVEKHFSEFDLKERFSIEAASELATLKYVLHPLFSVAGRVGVQQHLLTVASGEKENFQNSWKTALYQSLAKSDWYIDGGYSLE